MVLDKREGVIGLFFVLYFVKIRTVNKLVTPDMEFCFDVLKPLSRRFSDLFVYSRRDGERVLRCLVGCCLDQTSISDYCEDHRAVSADTALKLGYVPLEAMTRACNVLLRMSVGIGLKTGLFKGCSTSIDYHDVPYHGERRDYTFKTEVKGRVRRCYRYAVSSLTGNKRFSATAVQLYRQGDGNRKMVEKLLDASPRGFDPVLMDRGFAGADVYDAVEERGRTFITPYKVNDRTDGMYKESLLDGITVRLYNLRRNGGRWRSVYMHFVPSREDEYHVLASNEKDIQAREVYRYRWGEENLFKTLECLRPVTSTTHESFRLLLFTISLILASLWKLLVRSKEHRSVRRFRKQLLAALEDHGRDSTLEDGITGFA
jgi:IS4 transposase